VELLVPEQQTSTGNFHRQSSNIANDSKTKSFEEAPPTINKQPSNIADGSKSKLVDKSSPTINKQSLNVANDLKSERTKELSPTIKKQVSSTGIELKSKRTMESSPKMKNHPLNESQLGNSEKSPSRTLEYFEEQERNLAKKLSSNQTATRSPCRPRPRTFDVIAENDSPFHLQEEMDFWRSRQEINFGSPEVTSDVNTAIAWISREVSRYLDETYRSEAYRQKESNSLVHLHDLISRDELPTDILWEPFPCLKGMPSTYESLEGVGNLWLSLDAVFKEFGRRDRIRNEVYRRNITNIHRAIKRFHDEKSDNKVNLELELNKRTEQVCNKLNEEYDRNFKQVESESESKIHKLDSQVQLLKEQLNASEARRRHLESELESRKEMEVLKIQSEVHKKLDQQRKDMKEEMTYLQEALAIDKEQFRQLARAEKERLSQLYVSLEQEQSDQTAALKLEISQLQAELLTTRDKMVNQKAVQAKKHKSIYEERIKAIESKTTQLVHEHETLVKSLEHEHQDKINCLRKEFNMQLEMARRQAKNAEVQMRKTQALHEKKVQELNKEMRAKEIDYLKDTDRIRKEMVMKNTFTSSRLGFMVDLESKKLGLDDDSNSSIPPPPPYASNSSKYTIDGI